MKEVKNIETQIIKCAIHEMNQVKMTLLEMS